MLMSGMVAPVTGIVPVKTGTQYTPPEVFRKGRVESRRRLRRFVGVARDLGLQPLEHPLQRRHLGFELLDALRQALLGRGWGLRALGEGDADLPVTPPLHMRA